MCTELCRCATQMAQTCNLIWTPVHTIPVFLHNCAGKCSRYCSAIEHVSAQNGVLSRLPAARHPTPTAANFASSGRSNPGRISQSREDHGRGGTSVSGGPRSRGDFGRGGAAVAGEPKPRRDRSRGGTAVVRGAWGVDSGGGTAQRRQRRGGRGGADLGRPWGWRGGGKRGRGRGEGGWWFRTVFSAVPAD